MDVSIAALHGLGGAFQRSMTSLRRAGVHGWTSRACAEQECAAQCTCAAVLERHTPRWLAATKRAAAWLP
jgi:hypothetical protein